MVIIFILLHIRRLLNGAGWHGSTDEFISDINLYQDQVIIIIWHNFVIHDTIYY